MVLAINLGEDDYKPISASKELLAFGGWKLNMVSTVDPQCSASDVVEGYNLLGKTVPIDRLFLPFLYSDVLRYAKTRFLAAEPQWTNLLRMCYWYNRCSAIKDNNFHYKQTEIKKALLRPLFKVEKAISSNGRNFLRDMNELSRAVSSLTPELMYAALTNQGGWKVSFSQKHDFLIDGRPAEVKTLFSHSRIEDIAGGDAQLSIGGQVLGNTIDFPTEISNFVTSKKVWEHIGKAIRQGGLITFLDCTHTFPGILLNFLGHLGNINFRFSEALSKSVELASRDIKTELPVIFSASANSYQHKCLLLWCPSQ